MRVLPLVPCQKPGQQRVTVESMSADVDAAIAPLIAALWRRGWHTKFSCALWTARGDSMILFVSGRDAEAFLAAVADDGQAERLRVARADPSPFTLQDIGYEPLGANWSYSFGVDHIRELSNGARHARSALMVVVLFPRSDLERITARLSGDPR